MVRLQFHELDGVPMVMHRVVLPQVKDSETVTTIGSFLSIAIPATTISLIVPNDSRIVRSLCQSITTTRQRVWRREGC